jgi:hypothetical protein
VVDACGEVGDLLEGDADSWDRSCIVQYTEWHRPVALRAGAMRLR